MPEGQSRGVVKLRNDIAIPYKDGAERFLQNQIGPAWQALVQQFGESVALPLATLFVVEVPPFTAPDLVASALGVLHAASNMPPSKRCWSCPLSR